MLKVGDVAPNFKLSDKDGKVYELSSFLGKKVVVYFYPKDDTPGCRTQACSFRDNYGEFSKKGIVVIGISKDDQKSHKKFVEKHSLPFILLSDDTLEVVNKYGVYGEKMMYGKTYFGVNRVTFLINEKGHIEKIFEKANPNTNAEEILEYYK